MKFYYIIRSQYFIFIIFVCCILACNDFLAEDLAESDSVILKESDVMLTTRTLYEHHGIGGPGKQFGFMEEGSHMMSDMELRTIGSIGDRWNTGFVSNVRFTRSRQYDPENASVMYLQYIASDDSNHITLGDYHAHLSHYSLNRGVKGLGYQNTRGEHKYIRLVGGSFHSQWEHLFSQKEEVPVDRQVIGARIQTGEDNYRVGLNLVTAWDRENDPKRTTETTYSQILPSLDWEYRHPALHLTGEHSYAPTRRQFADRNNENITGTANRVNAHANLGRLNLHARSEHVTPNFITMGGGAIIDQHGIFTRGDYRLNRTWSLYAGNDWYRNNLENQFEATTRTLVPEVGIIAHGLFNRQSLSFSYGVRRRIVSTESPHRWDTVTDRLTFSLGDRFKSISVRGEVEVLINEHKRPGPGFTREDYLYRLVTDSSHLIMDESIHLLPHLTLEHHEVEDHWTGSPVRTSTARFDLRALIRNDMTLGFNLESRSTRSNIPDRDNSDEARLALLMEKRPGFLSGGKIQAELGHNRYRFSTSDRNYKENFVLFSMGVMFSKGK